MKGKEIVSTKRKKKNITRQIEIKIAFYQKYDISRKSSSTCLETRRPFLRIISKIISPLGGRVQDLEIIRQFERARSTFSKEKIHTRDPFLASCKRSNPLPPFLEHQRHKEEKTGRLHRS